MSAVPTRAFVAIFPPPGVAAAIDATLAPLRGAGVKWVRAENVHFTLRFLGPLAPPRVEAARRAVVAAAAAPSSASFRVRLGGPGAFPGPRRPRVLWIGAREGAAPLAHLAGEVERALGREKFPAADRPFTPHLTVGRAAGDEAPAAEFLAAPPLDLEFDVCELLLVASTLAPGGSRYAPLERVALGGGGEGP